jgi:hypothetical protein
MFPFPQIRRDVTNQDADAVRVESRSRAIAGEPRWLIAITFLVLLGVSLLFVFYVSPF